MFVVPWFPMGTTHEPFRLKWPPVEQNTARDAVFNVEARIERHVFVHLVDRIKSLTDVAARLRAVRDSDTSVAAQAAQYAEAEANARGRG